MAKASWGGKIIAESSATVVVEGIQYFPPESVNKDSSSQAITLRSVRGRALPTISMLQSTACRTTTLLGTTPSRSPAAAESRTASHLERHPRQALTPAHPRSFLLRDLILEHRSIVHHKPHVLQFSGNLQRISGHRDHFRVGAGSDHPDLSFHVRISAARDVAD